MTFEEHQSRAGKVMTPKKLRALRKNIRKATKASLAARAEKRKRNLSY